jgi:hypothetical protein
VLPRDRGELQNQLILNGAERLRIDKILPAFSARLGKIFLARETVNECKLFTTHLE